jgi:hypothetical protein
LYDYTYALLVLISEIVSIVVGGGASGLLLWNKKSLSVICGSVNSNWMHHEALLVTIRAVASEKGSLIS